MEIRWKVTDPLCNEIFLTDETFSANEDIDERIKYAVEHPRFIVKSPNFEGRRIYLDWAEVAREDIVHVRPLFIVTEADGKVVTWYARRSSNINVPQDGGILYDSRIRYLQV